MHLASTSLVWHPCKQVILLLALEKCIPSANEISVASFICMLFLSLQILANCLWNAEACSTWWFLSKTWTYFSLCSMGSVYTMLGSFGMKMECLLLAHSSVPSPENLIFSMVWQMNAEIHFFFFSSSKQHLFLSQQFPID